MEVGTGRLFWIVVFVSQIRTRICFRSHFGEFSKQRSLFLFCSCVYVCVLDLAGKTKSVLAVHGIILNEKKNMTKGVYLTYILALHTEILEANIIFGK